MSEAEVLTAQIDSTLDAQVEAAVPAPYRGEKKVSMRTDYALRDWLRGQQSEVSGSATAGTTGRGAESGRIESNPPSGG